MNTQIVKINRDDFSDAELLRAAELIHRGGLVAFPTETVYGLGADATSADAAVKIYAAKGRPQDNPLIVHVAEAEDFFKYCVIENEELFYKLCLRFMPGPLTLIYPKKDIIPKSVTGGLDTVAVRFPAHPIARRLIALSGVPIAAPSANLSGKPSPTRAEHVIEDLSGRVDMIIDGGECDVGLESTVVAVKGDSLTILRPGGVTYEDLKEVTDRVEIDENILKKTEMTQAPASPGMKYRHYSPATPLFAVKGSEERILTLFRRELKEGGAVICCDEDKAHLVGGHILSLGSSADLKGQAKRLFDLLRTIDTLGANAAFTRLPPREGIGLASLNRLLRACGFSVLDADMLVVGVCGQSGSGKSAICSRAAHKKGFVHIDCDEVYRQIIERGGECLARLTEAFGREILDAHGRLDRKAVSKIVFADSEKRQLLNKITHAYILKEVKERIKDARLEENIAVIIEAPLLFESGFDRLCDLNVAIVADHSEKTRRIIKRDGITETAALGRLRSQLSDLEIIARCDCVLENNGGVMSISKLADKLTSFISSRKQ